MSAITSILSRLTGGSRGARRGGPASGGLGGTTGGLGGSAGGSRSKDEAIGRGVRSLLRRFR